MEKGSTGSLWSISNFGASHELEELVLEDNSERRVLFPSSYFSSDSQITISKKMQRRSYYPHLISTATSSGLASSPPATPASDLWLGVEGEMRMDGSGGIIYHNNFMELNGRGKVTMKD